MSDERLRRLMVTERRGVPVTLKRDGRPQLSNVAYVSGADDVLRISVTDGRAKTRNLRRDPRASLYVGGADFGSYAVVEGTVTMLPVAGDPHDATVDALVAYYRDVAGEHPSWDEYRQSMVEEGRLLLELNVERFYGMA